MSNFDFISDDILRRIIERDKKELDECLSSNLYKSTILLSGSLIEAILVDYFLAFTTTHTNSEILQAPLAQLINWAFDEKLISQRTVEISTVIRNYRNLIHPGKEYRISERVDQHSATVAKHLVEIVIEEIGDSYSKKLGYKAESAIAKVNIDPSASSMFKHMVEQMSVIERAKLFRLIPQVCAEQEVLSVENFIRLHVLLSENIPQTIIKSEVEKIKDFLNHKSREEILFHLRFYIRHLNLLTPQERSAIIVYLLDVLSTGTEETLQQLKLVDPTFLGKYIEADGQQDLLINAVMKRYNKSFYYEETVFFNLLENILIGLPYDFGGKLSETFQKIGEEKSLEWADTIGSFIPF